MRKNTKCKPAAHAVLVPLFLSTLLSACGGGSDPDPQSSVADGGATFLPTVITSEGRSYNTCSENPVCSGNPLAPLTAFLTMAPAAGAQLQGIVRLELNGVDMANAELLPATGYAPRYGVFRITGDKTRAWLDLDTTRLPNGALTLRISAFDVPAGQSGAKELVSMPARTWTINNPATTPAPFTAALASAPASGAVIAGTTRLEVRGSSLANVELLPASGYTRLGKFNISADRTYAWLDLDPHMLAEGSRNVRISAFSATEGQSGASEIVAMPARAWTIRHNRAPGFVAAVTLAAPHGASVNGVARLEVRGSGLQNVELLPPSGYSPRLGVFNISGDRTFAWLDLDTRALPNGPLDARISAFNVGTGQPNAVEAIAMPTRQWIVQN